MECWNIGGLGLERINPSFHSSTVPIFGTLDAQGNRHMSLFQQPVKDYGRITSTGSVE